MKALIILFILLIIGLTVNAQPSLESTLNMQTEIIDSLQGIIKEQGIAISHLKQVKVETSLPTYQFVFLAIFVIISVAIGKVVGTFFSKYAFGVVVKKRENLQL